MIANSVSSSPPLPGGGAASELQPLITCSVFLVTSRILGHLSNISSGVTHGPVKNRPCPPPGKGFGSFVSKPELGQRPGVVFILHPDLQTNMEESIDGSTGQSEAGGLLTLLQAPTLDPKGMLFLWIFFINKQTKKQTKFPRSS